MALCHGETKESPCPLYRNGESSDLRCGDASREEIMRLKDKIAIVTGGAHGRGAAEAKLFAEQGATVVVADVREREGEQLAAAIRQAGGNAAFATLDVTDDANWQRVIDGTVATHGRLDIL